MVVVKPFGPHHFSTCCGSVQALNTISRGASKIRVNISSRSGTSAAVLVFPALVAAMLFLPLLCFLLHLAQIVVQPVEALGPEFAVMLHPVGHIAQRTGLQPARPPLRLASPR